MLSGSTDAPGMFGPVECPRCRRSGEHCPIESGDARRDPGRFRRAGAAAFRAAQNCGWSRVDHRVSYDASGVWNPIGLPQRRRRADDRGGWRSRSGRAPKPASARPSGKASIRELIATVAATAGKSIFTRVRPSTARQPLSVVPGRLQLQLSERRGVGRRGAGHAVRARVRAANTRRPMRCCCCRCTSARGGSRTRRTGRPTSWRAGSSAGCPAGTHTAATFRS